MKGLWQDLNSFGSAPAIQLADGKTYSYEQLAQDADAITERLGSRALVAIECENHYATLAAYLGCVRKGAVPLLVDAQLDISFRQALYSTYQVAWLWTKEGTTSYQWQALHPASPPLHPELGLLLSTSGSTGSPRLVRLSRKNLQSNAEAIAEYLKISADERPITTLPFHYSYGLSVVNSHLLKGACLLLTKETLISRAFWDFCKTAQVTSIAGVPETYAMLKRLRFERMDLPSLRLMTQAGGRLAPDLVQWYAELAKKQNREFIVMYGQTEATARIAYLPFQQVFERPGSIGQAIPGGELFLRDENGQVMTQPEHSGELMYRGPNVMLGYADAPDDLAKGDILQGLLATGDLAKRDEAGYFYVTGRLKRFIKIHGNRFGLDEIERCLQGKGWPVYVTGEDDQLWIVLEGESNLSHAELAKQVSLMYHLHPSVFRLVSVAQVPRSSAGKVQYAQLLQSLQTQVAETRT